MMEAHDLSRQAEADAGAVALGAEEHLLKTIALHPAIKRRPAQAQFAGNSADVAFVLGALSQRLSAST